MLGPEIAKVRKEERKDGERPVIAIFAPLREVAAEAAKGNGGCGEAEVVPVAGEFVGQDAGLVGEKDAPAIEFEAERGRGRENGVADFAIQGLKSERGPTPTEFRKKSFLEEAGV
jgi:hypothetical protein